MCACVQQTPERVGQSEAMYEVVSLQREAERSNEERGRLASPTEEEEADEGIHFSCFFFHFAFLLALLLLVLVKLITYSILYASHIKLHIHQ